MTYLGPTRQPGLAGKIARLNWALITILCAIAFIGVMMQYSVAATGPERAPIVHGLRFIALLVLAIGLATLDQRFWLGLAYPLYVVALLLTLAVEIPGLGATRGGAESWLAIGPLQGQPSELMKIAIVLTLARYYAGLEAKRALHVVSLIPPLFLIAVPTLLVAQQPDLGTAVMIALPGLAIMFLAGLRWRFIIPALILAVVGAVAAYQVVLQDYQRERIIVFVETMVGSGVGAQADDAPAGPTDIDSYNIDQSLIAIGSAGLLGAGYMQGPQSQGDFLPEKHTDFIFTMIVEEFGLLGGLGVLALFMGLLAACLRVALTAKSTFGKLAAAGVTASTAAYTLINTAMVTGLFPVVGLPLPLVSHGGTSMLTTMVGMAVVLSVDLHKEQTGARGMVW
ncbi:MAG: rod shape-determining protein RodA [Alphaproteobacteria bacterium]|nr:rod shape-determining protein RodA [Alphaproteobacteria bacterium]